ncbi:MAG: elongation factor G [Candidatus Shikimatogenerans sp. JK-2022]|nr:elongation factor G [Candidatus Shikimatogenerans bostrichidophilus]
MLSETVWYQANKYKIPRIAYINKMDRKGANFINVCKQIKNKLKSNTIILQYPIFKNENFIGIIDLLLNKSIIWEEKNYGRKYYYKKVPINMKNITKKYRVKLLEILSEYNDKIMEYYLSNKPIKTKYLIKVIREQTHKMNLVPILCGSSFKNKGVQILLNSICLYLPSPLKSKIIIGKNLLTNKKCKITPYKNKYFCSLVFKISSDKFVGKLVFIRVYTGTLKIGDYVYNIRSKKKEKISRMYQMHANKQIPISKINAGDIFAGVGLKDIKTGDTLCSIENPILLEKIKFPKPVIGISIEPQNKTDLDKMSIALSKIIEEDPTFDVKIDKNTSETIIYGMGELHLDIILDRIEREYNIKLKKGIPKVEYKEKFKKKVTYREIFKKQTGGRGKYADILFTIGPYKEGKGLNFINKVKGGNIPKEYIISVQKGFKESMKVGPLLGYEVESMEIVLLDGSYHPVDSDTLSFEIAAKNGFKIASLKTSPVLMEPIMKLEVISNEESLGNIVSDINKRRGIIKEILDFNNKKLIKSLVPLSEMFGYVTNLRSLSSGRATSNMIFSHYEELSKEIINKLIKKNE